MGDKEDMWAESFRIMVEYAGRMSVSDLKHVVAFFDTLTEEEQVRFDTEVENERRRRYDDFFSSNETVETVDDSEDEIRDEQEVITTFEDIERMNALMNDALKHQSVRHENRDVSTKQRSKK